MYIYSALPVLVVSFLLGAMVGVLVHSGYKRHQAKKKKSRAPLSGYEEVGLAEDAGGTINLRDNIAYEMRALQQH